MFSQSPCKGKRMIKKYDIGMKKRRLCERITKQYRNISNLSRVFLFYISFWVPKVAILISVIKVIFAGNNSLESMMRESVEILAREYNVCNDIFLHIYQISGLISQKF